MNNKRQKIREWINRDNGKWLRVGNYELNGLEILGYFLFVCGLLGLSLAKHELSETHKYISIGLGLSGLAVGLCGNIKNGRDKNKN